METTMYRSVTEQTINVGFHIINDPCMIWRVI